MSKALRPITIVGDLAYVLLTQGCVAIIDAVDVHLIEGANWYAVKTKSGYYAGRNVDGRIHFMHHAVHGRRAGMLTDHKNGNGLDNRRENLRDATNGQNMANRRRSSNAAKAKGVSYVPKLGKFKAYLQVNKVRHTLGYFDTMEEARAAYDAGAILHFGEFAAPNSVVVIH